MPDVQVSADDLRSDAPFVRTAALMQVVSMMLEPTALARRGEMARAALIQYLGQHDPRFRAAGPRCRSVALDSRRAALRLYLRGGIAGQVLAAAIARPAEKLGDVMEAVARENRSKKRSVRESWRTHRTVAHWFAAAKDRDPAWLYHDDELDMADPFPCDLPGLPAFLLDAERWRQWGQVHHPRNARPLLSGDVWRVSPKTLRAARLILRKAAKA